jgi:putative flippase GtrA
VARKNPFHLAQNKKVRFVLVGGFNTVVDFTIYNLASQLLGLALPLANMISTVIAMSISFVLNKKWTFNSQSKNYAREVVLFFIFTLIGIWIIQSGLIWLIENWLLSQLDWQNFWLKNGVKVVATLPSLVWNYLAYNKIVFKSQEA